MRALLTMLFDTHRAIRWTIAGHELRAYPCRTLATQDGNVLKAVRTSAASLSSGC
jgi:hypothetical protein